MSQASRQASKQQKMASALQIGAMHRSEEQAAAVRGEQAVAGIRLRGLGRRALAFQGYDNGLAPTLAG